MAANHQSYQPDIRLGAMNLQETQMTTNDLFFTPVNFDRATILLGHIQYVVEQPFDSYKEKWPAVVVLTNGKDVDIPLTVEQATERMYRRAAEFRRSVGG